MSDPFANQQDVPAPGLTPGEQQQSAQQQTVQRPIGDDRGRQRLAGAWRQVADRWQTRRAAGADSIPDNSFDLPRELTDDFFGPPGGRWSAVNTILIVVGAAALALAGLWGWQSWSQRSAEPIDDLLPILVASEIEPPTIEPPRSSASSATGVEGAAPQQAAPREVTVDPAIDPGVEPGVEPDVPIIVHVSGAVVRSGVVQLLDGARVFEAIDAAGGSAEDADLDRVNLAAPLRDGERIHVPRIDEEQLPVVVQPEPPPPRPSLVADDVERAPEMIDINAASVTELQLLPGVGPSTAQAIVATREARGPFLSVDELLEVPGIGQAKLTALAAHAVVIVP